jgi:4-carboxymuconolactone decarboxylase
MGAPVRRLRGKGRPTVKDTDVLRLLAISDEHISDSDGAERQPEKLDPKTTALVRLAALVAVGGPGPSFRAEADAAISAGATAGEIVDVLVGVTGVVGLPSVVAAAPRLALALGYDIDDALERTRPWSDL